MKYPRKSPYLIYGKTENSFYKVEDLLHDDIWLLDYEEMAILSCLDGRHDPYELLPEYNRDYIQKTLEDFEKHYLLAPKKKLQSTGIGSYSIPLIYCNPGKAIKQFAEIYNFLLMTLFLPVFVLGLFLGKSNIFWIFPRSISELVTAIFIGGFVGIAMHEISHAFAALAYGGNLFEIGVGTSSFLPIGYVLLYCGNVRGRMKQIQIDAAGVEMNMLLCGVFMLLKPILIRSCIIDFFALANLTIAVLNILPLDGHDGLNILSKLFEKDDLLKYAKGLIKDSRNGEKNRSVHSFIAVVLSYSLVGFQIITPLITITEAYSLVRLLLWSVL